MKIIIVLFLIYLFMILPRMFNKPDRKPFMGYHYAHRGLFNNDSETPENSLPAFKKAVEKGYGIELDVQLTKDDKLVVFHDASLKRMCNIDGKVWEYTLEELQHMTLSGSSQTIPTFEEVLAVIDGKVPFILEYKLDRVQTKVCELSNEVLKNYKGHYCIECFHPLAVMWYKKNRPDILRGQLSSHFWKEGDKRIINLFPQFLLTNVLARPDFIAYHHTDCNLSLLLNKLFGALMVTWTIQSEEDYKKAKKRYDLFIFDSFELKD
ncbi:MAG: glycerophosphodiester phosphodiesterase family protein [Bacilli bacterium]|nr:glycerophosphodiester phosphodiesterase family protein [Bacilli bacterium]